MADLVIPDGRLCQCTQDVWQTMSHRMQIADHVTQDMDGRACQGTQDVDCRPCQGTQGEDGRLYQDVDRW